MTLISNIQVSGLDRTGKTTFLRETMGFGSRVHHFPQPMAIQSPVATYHSLTQVLEEITAFPAKRDCLNSLTIWDRGLIEPFVYDCVRRFQTMTIGLWKEYFDQFKLALGKTRSIYFITTKPLAGVEPKDEQDRQYATFENRLRDRFLAAADYLTLWGEEVHVVDNFASPTAHDILLSKFHKHEVIGLGHRIEQGKVILGGSV